MYLWPQTSSMEGFHRRFGVMTRPADKCVPRGIREGRLFGVENEAFTRPAFEMDRWLAHWRRLEPYGRQCMFVTVPDVVGDVQGTLARWQEWAPRLFDAITSHYPLARRSDYHGWLGLAYVAQDGAEDYPFPAGADWIFIGGTTEWKWSSAADAVMRRAWDAGLFIHVGRVNSKRAYWHFAHMEVTSVDGTAARFEPSTARRRLAAAMQQPRLLTGQPVMEDA